ncbi:hypothetical protein ACVW16_000155 [Bradyrhizobium sp. USDA 4474]
MRRCRLSPVSHSARSRPPARDGADRSRLANSADLGAPNGGWTLPPRQKRSMQGWSSISKPTALRSRLSRLRKNPRLYLKKYRPFDEPEKAGSRRDRCHGSEADQAEVSPEPANDEGQPIEPTKVQAPTGIVSTTSATRPEYGRTAAALPGFPDPRSRAHGHPARSRHLRARAGSGALCRPQAHRLRWRPKGFAKRDKDLQQSEALLSALAEKRPMS